MFRTSWRRCLDVPLSAKITTASGCTIFGDVHYLIATLFCTCTQSTTGGGILPCLGSSGTGPPLSQPLTCLFSRVSIIWNGTLHVQQPAYWNEYLKCCSSFNAVHAVNLWNCACENHTHSAWNAWVWLARMRITENCPVKLVVDEKQKELLYSEWPYTKSCSTWA